jgi:hypothetical protein
MRSQKEVWNDEPLPRVRGHVIGENKFRPIRQSIRSCPEPIQECVRLLFVGAAVSKAWSRSKKASAVAAVLKKPTSLDFEPFERQGVRPVAVYVNKRRLCIKFCVGVNLRVFIAHLYDNDL